MSDLSPELQDLVLASKSANLPTDADSARIFEALRTRLGDAAVFGESGEVGVTASTTGIAVKKVALVSVAGLALLGGLMLYAARNHHAAPSISKTAESAASSRVAPAQVASVDVAPSPPEITEERSAPAAASAEHTEARQTASRHPRDSLSEEVTILSRAETALHSGKPELALKLLSEHERKFGNGLLREERIAARVQALCALGRTSEADAQMARLSPKSLHGKSQACGAR